MRIKSDKINVTLTRLAQCDPILIGKDLEEVFELLAKEILNLKRQIKILNAKKSN